MLKISRLLLLCVCVVVGVTRAQSSASAIQKISIIQLINSPEQFDGKIVQVHGFLQMTREGDLLFLHEEDSKNQLMENAIWIRRTELMGKDRLNLDRKYVTVVGTFRAGFTEHEGVPPNGIREVSNVIVWSDPSHPIRERLSQIPGVSTDH